MSVLQKYGSLTRVARLKLVPNMADQINLNVKETVALMWGTANILTPGHSCPNITV